MSDLIMLCIYYWSVWEENWLSDDEMELAKAKQAKLLAKNIEKMLDI